VQAAACLKVWSEGVLRPLTPDPSPLPGARGAMCVFQCDSKTQNPPLAPVKRGRGVRGEGDMASMP